MADLSDLEQVRKEKMEALRAAGVEPYPPGGDRTHTTAQALEAYQAADEDHEVEATLVGRIKSIRDMGKTVFAHIEDGEGQLQLYLRVDEIGEESLEQFKDHYDLGDYVQASGTLFRTRTEEETLRVTSLRMLAKAITPLPTPKVEEIDGEEVVHDAFSDPEARYRQRYVDLAVNPEVRDVFRTRTKIVRALQSFLDERGFIEVETPVLQPVYGGAAATPFVTHHNQLHQDLYLRISFELYLKRLLVGNLERVYEIGRDFRNEGVSYKHNPEFTMLEFYMAYADYEDIMELTERMVAETAEAAVGSTSIEFKGDVIDLSPPWRRITLHEAVSEYAGVDLNSADSAETLRAEMRALDLDPDPEAGWGKLVDALLGSKVEPELVQPTILYDYPRSISPLARRKPDQPGLVERFEAFVGGMELCNAFTELNDPFDQEERFLEMGRTYEEGDEERHPMDEDYLRAMRYGMPPNGGFGMGIDRLTMLLTDRSNIREVILFPHLRPREE